MIFGIRRLALVAPLALTLGAIAGVLVLSVELIDALNPPHQNSDRFANVGRGS